MPENLTRQQLEAFNRADAMFNNADDLFEASNRAIALAIYALWHLRFRAAYGYHDSAIRLRRASRVAVERAIEATRQAHGLTGEHCHVAYRKNRILRSPSRQLRAQMCTMFYGFAATIAVVAVLFLVYSWRIGIL